MLMERLGRVENEARALCRKALTTVPELRPHTSPLEEAIRHLDAHPALVSARASVNGRAGT
jgi:hypothetical protein